MTAIKIRSKNFPINIHRDSRWNVTPPFNVDLYDNVKEIILTTLF